jgi:hypothetical protein
MTQSELLYEAAAMLKLSNPYAFAAYAAVRKAAAAAAIQERFDALTSGSVAA